MTTTGRVSNTVALAALLVLAWSVPAAADVEIDPGTAVKGADAELAFRVPNELDNADTTQVDIKFPTDHPIASVSVKEKPGWTYQVKTEQLAKPITTDDGQVTQVVSQITWSGGKIAPGEYDDFQVSAGPLPTDTDQIVFPTLQTYSNGTVVSWIETQQAGGPTPEHPAPVLHLVDKASDLGGATAAGPGPSSAAPTTAVTAITESTATKAQVHSANTKALIGIIVGSIGLALGIAGITLAARKPSDAGSGD